MIISRLVVLMRISIWWPWLMNHAACIIYKNSASLCCSHSFLVVDWLQARDDENTCSLLFLKESDNQPNVWGTYWDSGRNSSPSVWAVRTPERVRRSLNWRGQATVGPCVVVGWLVVGLRISSCNKQSTIYMASVGSTDLGLAFGCVDAQKLEFVEETRI